MTELSKWTAEPLHWGEGPLLFEAFLEPTCPFSVIALGKLMPLLQTVGADRMQVRIILHSQPWHMFSPVLVRAILAASTLEGGRAAAWRAMQAIAEHRDDYEFVDHAGGPNLDVTPKQILARLEAHSGLGLAAAFAIPDLDRVVKRHTRYARQNGIHVSPTFMINGLVDSGLSSGDSVQSWADRLVESAF